ncbi:MAG: TVP38/TMEM64 family protein [Deltaproteobacteria bacterium]|nr:TVP38/TMEM64 family protein [Deltaproteobacteria bacterium]
MKRLHKLYFFYGLLFLIFIALGLFYYFSPLGEGLRPHEIRQIKVWVKEHHWVAPWLYILLFTVGTVLCIPATFFSFLGGIGFDVTEGTLLSLLGSNLGAWACYFISRSLSKPFVEHYLAGSMEYFIQRLSKKGFSVVVWIRLLPLFPYSLQNYAFGLSKVKWRDYFFGNLVGMFPWSFGLVTLGDIAIKISFQDPRILFRLEIWGPLLLVAMLMILPQFLKLNRRMVEKFRRFKR